MKIIYIIACGALLTPISIARAEIKEVVPKEEGKIQTEANVYFASSVSPNSISDLVAVLDRIRINYRSVEKINLLINSPGGAVSSGIQAYWNLKSYPLPIHAINVGDVSSAATFLFCAANERSSVPFGTFLLHPPAAGYSGGYVKPDEVERTREYLHSDNLFMESIYKTCTNMDADDIKDMLKAEYNSKFLSDKQAEKIGLTNSALKGIPQAASSFFVQEKES